jgi:hypothetical protein
MKNITKTLQDLKDGEQFRFGGQRWIALDGGNAATNIAEKGRGRLCLTANILKTIPFDVDNNNNWRMSSIRKYLNGEFLDELTLARIHEGLTAEANNGMEILQYISDLTADDGLKDYGVREDLVFLLSADDYRRNRYAIPDAIDWWWLATPYSTPNSGHSHSVRFVNADGALSDASAYNGYGGLRPALYLKSDILVSTK